MTATTSRDRLCRVHSKGEAASVAPLPPEGSHLCPICREAADAKVAAASTGTSTKVVISTHASEDEYFAGVTSPVARKMLEERRAREHQEAEVVAAAIAESDAMRPLVVALDQAKPGRERRDAHRRLMKAARGPRWEA